MSQLFLGVRDRAVYAWEYQWVDPNDHQLLNESEIRGIVPYVWRDMGLLNPPMVELSPRENSRSGSGNRIKVTFGTSSHLTVILHELAHSMDVSLETSMGASAMRPKSEVGGGSYHDENWLGLYVKMLDRYIGGRHFNLFWLYNTLAGAGLTVSLAPKPRCI